MTTVSGSLAPSKGEHTKVAHYVLTVDEAGQPEEKQESKKDKKTDAPKKGKEDKEDKE